MAFEILRGGLYVVTVQTEPGLVDTVLHAARKALKDLATIRPIQEFQLESAKKQVISRHMHDKKLGRYWMELLAGVQLDDVSGDDEDTISHLREKERWPRSRDRISSVNYQRECYNCRETYIQGAWLTYINIYANMHRGVFVNL